MDESSTRSSSEEDLQFDRAEYDGDRGGLTCAFCESSIYDVYFEINQRPACEQCRYDVEQRLTSGSPVGRFVRAFAAGTAAAVAGALVYYGVMAATGYEFGLVAIVVGLLVGFAVRWGSRGRGGWAYQGLAVALTYVAIVSTYVPFIFRAWEEQEQAAQQEGAAPAVSSEEVSPAPAIEEGVSPAAATPATEGPVTGGQIVVALALFGLFVLAVPFLAGFENIMGIVIIGIGLYEAWKINKRAPLEIAGPLRVGKVAPSPLPSLR